MCIHGSVMIVRLAKDFALNEANLRQRHVQLKNLISSNSAFRKAFPLHCPRQQRLHK